jgi:tetratricopeptide (TPR) repeat protein
MNLNPASPLRQTLRYAGALLLLALAGWALQPLRLHLQQQESAAHLRLPAPDYAKTDALSQQLALFALGGLRTFAAEMLCVDTTNAWLQQDWPRAERRWKQVTTLCPRRVNYWIRASRDMAKNAVAWVQEQEEPGSCEQAVQSKYYLDSAEQFLLEGIANNPDSALLWLHLGAFDEDLSRRTNFTRAVEDYRRALELGASPMYRRWVFYNLCRIRGREKEAWELGRALYQEERHRSPSLRCLLLVLQHKLDIPTEQQFTPEQLFGSSARAEKQLRAFLRNDLRFPTAGIREILNGLSQ